MFRSLYFFFLVFFIDHTGYCQTTPVGKDKGKKVVIPKEQPDSIIEQRKRKLKDSLSSVEDYRTRQNQILKVDSIPKIGSIPKVDSTLKINSIPKVDSISKIDGIPKVDGIPEFDSIPKVENIEHFLINTTTDSINNFSQNNLPGNFGMLQEKGKADSLKQWIENNQRAKLSSFGTAFDSLLSSKKVISERIIRDFYDSLGIGNGPLPGKKQEVSEEELINQINRKFFAIPVEEDKIGAINDNFPDKQSLSEQSLSPEFASQLPALAAQQLPSEYLEKIDSLKAINLKEQRIAVKEKHLSEDHVLMNLREKSRFWDRAYFEGIIGVANLEERVLQLTPALGMHLFDDFSIGMGPVIQLYEQNNTYFQSAIGLRQFIKQEFFKRKGYLQAEYIMNPRVENLENLTVERHSFLVGGGVIVPITGLFAMNIGLLYNLNDTSGDLQNGAPWVFRIGVSKKSNSKNN